MKEINEVSPESVWQKCGIYRLHHGAVLCDSFKNIYIKYI